MQLFARICGCQNRRSVAQTCGCPGGLETLGRAVRWAVQRRLRIFQSGNGYMFTCPIFRWDELRDAASKRTGPVKSNHIGAMDDKIRPFDDALCIMECLPGISVVLASTLRSACVASFAGQHHFTECLVSLANARAIKLTDSRNGLKLTAVLSGHQRRS
jgi:hypothetical protein